MAPPPGKLPSLAEFQSQVLSHLIDRWHERCFCASAQFCKIVSYDFRDYGHDVSCLVDAEFLIDSIIRKEFKPIGKAVEDRMAFVQEWQCPQCAAQFREEEEQFSISMWRSFARRIDRPAPNVVGQYVIGFRAFHGFDRSKVTDFVQASTLQSFIDGIIAEA